jgi:topoisomerase-4 subunit A
LSIAEITARFDDDMIVLEKWIPKKPISAIYYDGEKERYYVKRFLVENEGKEDSFITDHPNSQLEIVSTDWRPMADIEITKERGKDRKPNIEVNLEAFIAIKGISALGNQLTKEKINQISLLDPLPYEAPEEVPAEELEVIDEETISAEKVASQDSKNVIETTQKPSPTEDSADEPPVDDDGQAKLF